MQDMGVSSSKQSSLHSGMLVNWDSKQPSEMEAKVANMRYKPFAGLPPQASEKATFNCMGKVKEIPQRNGQHRRS